MGHPPLWPVLLLVILFEILAVVLTKLGSDDPPADAQREWYDLPEWRRGSRRS